MNRSSILLVDDHRLFGEVVTAALEQLGAHVVDHVETGADAIRAVARERPAVILLDLGLPDRHGIDVGKEILAVYPDMAIVALTASTDPRASTDALKAGFRGFVPKDAPLPRVVDAISTALDGQPVVIRHARRSTSTFGPGDANVELLASGLTDREREVLQLIVAGMGSRAMAEELHISMNTVRTHVQSVLTKLQVHSRLEAAAFAVRNGLVEQPRVSGEFA